jgi:hypothetical protein
MARFIRPTMYWETCLPTARGKETAKEKREENQPDMHQVLRKEKKRKKKEVSGWISAAEYGDFYVLILAGK